MMVGNSFCSDILLVLEMSGCAVHIPNDTTWVHETADPASIGQPVFYELSHIGELPALLERIEAG